MYIIIMPRTVCDIKVTTNFKEIQVALGGFIYVTLLA